MKNVCVRKQKCYQYRGMIQHMKLNLWTLSWSSDYAWRPLGWHFSNRIFAIAIHLRASDNTILKVRLCMKSSKSAKHNRFDWSKSSTFLSQSHAGVDKLSQTFSIRNTKEFWIQQQKSCKRIRKRKTVNSETKVRVNSRTKSTNSHF
jgi:hypothetical protein